MSAKNSRSKKSTGSQIKLRGQPLIDFVLHELRNVGSWDGELTWAKLAKRIGVSRQGMDRHEEISEAFAEAKRAIKKTKNTAKSIVRRDAETRIKDLQIENQRLNKLLDAYLENWLRMEANCLSLKLDPTAILGRRPVIN